MKRELSPPLVIGVIVVLVLVVVGMMVYSGGGPKDGLRPDASAGGIQTKGGKVIPTLAGTGGGASDTATAPAKGTSGPD